MARVELYPCGDVREWARRNWVEAVEPFMDEFIAALKHPRVDEEYFDGQSPMFLFLDVKVMHMLADELRGMPAREKSAIMSEVFFPYGQKWGEVQAAMTARLGACVELRRFKTKLALVADAVKLMFTEAGLENHVETIWDLRREMIESWGALRDQVCRAAAMKAPRRTRLRYCLPNEALAEMFGVSVKTIVRWKDESNQLPAARRLRMARENRQLMEQAAAMYRSQVRDQAQCRQGGRMAYNDEIDYSGQRRDR